MKFLDEVGSRITVARARSQVEFGYCISTLFVRLYEQKWLVFFLSGGDLFSAKGHGNIHFLCQYVDANSGW